METRPLPSDPRYLVTDTGIVFGAKGSPLKQQRAVRGGYLTVGVGGRTRYVHKLVLETFIGPPPEGLQVRHLNGMCTDNRLENLRYGTRTENQYDQVAHGTHPWANKTECPSGHRYTADNIYYAKRGDGTRFRQCKACTKARKAARRPEQIERARQKNREYAARRYAIDGRERARYYRNKKRAAASAAEQVSR